LAGGGKKKKIVENQGEKRGKDSIIRSQSRGGEKGKGFVINALKGKQVRGRKKRGGRPARRGGKLGKRADKRGGRGKKNRGEVVSRPPKPSEGREREPMIFTKR